MEAINGIGSKTRSTQLIEIILCGGNWASFQAENKEETFRMYEGGILSPVVFKSFTDSIQKVRASVENYRKSLQRINNGNY